MSTPFVQRLLLAAPELRPLYDNHIRCNDELLPYVLMGDVTRFMISNGCGETADFPAKKILDFFEDELASRGESSSDLIVLGFCENLLGEDQALAFLLPQMGPRLTNAMQAVSGE